MTTHDLSSDRHGNGGANQNSLCYRRSFFLVRRSNRVKKQPRMYMRAVFNKRIRVRICLESRNPESGHSARACSSLRITPPGAMNLLLRDRPEIAIYPSTISSCLFASFHLGWRYMRKKVIERGAFLAAFWKCDHVSQWMARVEFSARFSCWRSFVDAGWIDQIDTENSRGKSRWINLIDRFCTLFPYFFFWMGISFIPCWYRIVSFMVVFANEMNEKYYFFFRRSFTIKKKKK